MKSTSSKNRRSNAAAFTLVEIMVAIAIIVGIIGASIAGLVKASETGKAGAVASAIDSIKTAVKVYTDDHGGYFPVTETLVADVGQIPTTGSSTSGIAISNAATVETVLFTDRAIDSVIKLGVGPNVAPSGAPAPLPWNNATQTFTNSVATTWSNAACNRVECFVSTATATPLTATPVGSAYNLDGTNPLPAGKKVVSAIIPNCPASIAYKISKAIDGDGTLSNSNLAQADSAGAVIYATPVGGNTTVYVYVVDL